MAPEMTWDSWRRACELQTRTATFRRAMDAATRTLAAAAESRQNLFLSVSGGKDSIAMAGLAHALGMRCPWLCGVSELHLPGCLETTRAAAQQLGAKWYVVRPAALGEHVRRIQAAFPGGSLPLADPPDEWDLLRAFPADADVMDADCYNLLLDAVNSHAMMVAATYSQGYDGSIVGIRAGESKGRAANAATRGDRHRSAVDGKWTWWPLQTWTAQDVYGYIFTRDLPLHPFYRRAWEALPGVVEDPGRLRVDMGFGYEAGLQTVRGNMTLIAAAYPDYWRRLVAVRPELRRYA